MKKVLGILLLMIVASSFAYSCDNSERMAQMEAEKADHPERFAEREFEASFLFEYEGCRIYRFRDGGRYHYWAVQKDQASTITTQEYTNGKTTEYQEENIVTK